MVEFHGFCSSIVYIVRRRHPYAIWPGNETTCAHAYKIRKWRPSKRSAAAVCCEWHNLSKLQVLKTLCVAGPARWGRHCIRAKITVITWTVLELTWLTQMWWDENGTFATAHFCLWLSSTMLLRKLVSFAGCKITRRYALGTSLRLKRVRGWVSWLLLKHCIYCASAPSLYRESTDSPIIYTLKFTACSEVVHIS